MVCRWRSLLSGIASVLVYSSSLAFAADSIKQLAKPYQEFLTGPTSYLITRTERDAFLRLKSDGERNAAIEHFWKIRNPAPDLGTNEFQEEFNRRVAWANMHFGKDIGGDGWRSDRGKAYILFGPPKSSQNYLWDQQLYPIELWFYSNPGLSEVPAFFYVLFYDKDGIGGYKFYNPAVEGPEKLVRSGYTKPQAYQYLRNVNPELARATLSLIPGEPIDTDTFSGSMESQQIINAIQGYRDVKSYVSLIHEREHRLEHVKSEITYDLTRTSLATLVAFENGAAWLHYQIQVNDPKRPKAINGNAAYSIRAQIFSQGQLVFERTDSPSFAVPADKQDELKTRPFSFEDRMPVAPGKYRLTVSVKNNAADQSYEASREIVVDPPTENAALSDIIVFSRYERDGRTRPFQFAGIKFVPDASDQVNGVPKLNVCYQLRALHPAAAELPVEYVIGNVGGKFRKSFEDKLDLGKADQFGSLVIAKELSLEGVPAGSYQLAVRIKDPSTGKITGQSVSFTFVPSGEEKRPILVSQGRVSSPRLEAANDYERALCWLSQGREDEAVAALESSWKLSQNQAVRSLLEHLQHRNAGRPGSGHSELLKDRSEISKKENKL